MPRILFLDPTCPKPYSPASLLVRGLGGTEATVIRVAEGLAQSGTLVAVSQHNRTAEAAEVYGNSCYVGKEVIGSHGPWDAIVIVRAAGLVKSLRELYTGKIYLWLHDIAGQDVIQAAQDISHAKATVVGVSKFHKSNIIDALSTTLKPEQMPRVNHIYNPIDDALTPDATPYDKNKLVFFSSPCKGLDLTLQTFKNALSFNPDFKLYIANPGYQPSKDTALEKNVINLGVLPHHEVIKHVREALCVFHLNHVFPETMGLVYGECQAVGTPFISHGLGAVPELSDHPAQLVDVRDPKAVIDRLMAWHSGNRPRVRLNPEMRTGAVITAWRKLLT